MAKIMYQRENNLLLEPREAFYRPFDFGEWTEVRVGMLFRLVSTASDSSSIIVEDISLVNSDSDKIYFGIKDSGNNMPGVSGTNFIGMASFTGSETRADPFSPSSLLGDSFDANTRLYLTAFSGSSMYKSFLYQSNSEASLAFSSSASGSNYNGFYGIKFTLLNSGSANQQVQVTYRRVYTSPVGSSSADLHSQLVNNTGWTNPPGSNTASWTTGIPLPNSFFVYSPLYNNRLRMAAIEAIKIS